MKRKILVIGLFCITISLTGCGLLGESTKTETNQPYGHTSTPVPEQPAANQAQEQPAKELPPGTNQTNQNSFTSTNKYRTSVDTSKHVDHY